MEFILTKEKQHFSKQQGSNPRVSIFHMGWRQDGARSWVPQPHPAGKLSCPKPALPCRLGQSALPRP